MKNLKWWSLVGVTAMGAMLAGCGSGDSGTGSISLRVANATLTHSSIDFLINGTVVSSGVAVGTIGTYQTPSASGNTLQINDASGSTAIAPVTANTFTGGGHYTMVAYESAGSVKTFFVTEDTALPATGTTVRVYDAAIEAGKLDVYIISDPSSTTTAGSPCRNLAGLTPIPTFGVLTQPGPAQTQVNVGTYRVCVTGGGNKSDLRLDMPGLSTTAQTVTTVILTPASGGLLLNGATLVQQGTAYTALQNTGTRVRLASAATGGGSVSLTATAPNSGGTYTVSTGTVSPGLGSYVLVPQGSSLSITGPSGSVGAPATSLIPGSDMTLLVYGSSTGLTPSLILDDNRPPTDATTVKLRLINGITGAAGTLSLTANALPVANGIGPGLVSPYTAVNIISGQTTTLRLTSTTAPGNYLSVDAGLVPNTTYTVLAGGDAASPQIVLPN